MNKLSLSVLSLVGLSSLSGCAIDTPVPPPPPVYESYVDAPVVSAEPIYSQVAVPHPVQHCWQEQSSGGALGGTIIGGVAGGLLGSTIGRGGGNIAATIGGAAVGAAVGNQVGSQANPPGYYTKCSTTNEFTYQPQITSYDVTYTLNGNTYHTNVPYNPGSTIRVRSTVAPAY